MKGNPEFLRNLWLEISPYRLVMMPSVIGAFFLVAWAINGRTVDAATAQICAVLFAAIVVIWGSRIASESVIHEINNRTWDNQRMSALGPWALATGKLFGSTVFVWYGGLICMGLYALSYGELIDPVRLFHLVALYIGSGALCHAVGLLVSLQAVQKRREFGRIQVTFYQFLALAALAPVLYIGVAGFDDRGVYRVTSWYGHAFELLGATVTWLYLYLAWALVAVWRLMRTELQMVNGPWVWLGFVAFVVLHLAGLRVLPEEVSRVLPTLTGSVFAGFFALAVLTYLVALSEPKGRLVFRRLRQALQVGDWAGFVNRLPLSLFTVALLLVAALILLRIGEARITLFTADINFRLVVMAAALFVVRDVAVIMWINLLRPSPRADGSAFVALALVYTLVPVALAGVGLDALTAFFWPRWNATAALTLLPVTGEVLVFGLLLRLRWRRAVADDEATY
jgi:hypothetical protein